MYSVIKQLILLIYLFLACTFFFFYFIVGECKFDHGLWKTCGGRTCIYKEFFKDGKLNCPFKSCKDENGCQAVISVLNGKYFNLLIKNKICILRFQIF